MQDKFEVVASISIVVGEQVADFGLTRTYLDRISLDAIQDTCVNIKAVIARGIVESDDDVVAFFAISRHSF
jgi:hypothetical protein